MGLTYFLLPPDSRLDVSSGNGAGLAHLLHPHFAIFILVTSAHPVQVPALTSVSVTQTKLKLTYLYCSGLSLHNCPLRVWSDRGGWSVLSLCLPPPPSPDFFFSVIGTWCPLWEMKAWARRTNRSEAHTLSLTVQSLVKPSSCWPLMGRVSETFGQWKRH